jgi:hypothetical protein
MGSLLKIDEIGHKIFETKDKSLETILGHLFSISTVQKLSGLVK